MRIARSEREYDPASWRIVAVHSLGCAKIECGFYALLLGSIVQEQDAQGVGEDGWAEVKILIGLHATIEWMVSA